MGLMDQRVYVGKNAPSTSSGSINARLAFVCNDQFLVVASFLFAKCLPTVVRRLTHIHNWTFDLCKVPDLRNLIQGNYNQKLRFRKL
jgi:hypothetical protein